MAFINIEIKARTSRQDAIRAYLHANGADFKGIDHQTDTYFVVPRGRLKLRQGKIENALIYYERSNEFGPKQSDFNIVPVDEGGILKELLAKSLGIHVVVEKQREIYFIGNVKIHLDFLAALGDFVEIEASNRNADLSLEKLQEQCEFYMREFAIERLDLVNISYSDMILEGVGITNEGVKLSGE